MIQNKGMMITKTKFRQVLMNLDKFEQIWTMFGQVWTRFGQIWMGFGKFAQVLDKFGPYMGFGEVWLNEFG